MKLSGRKSHEHIAPKARHSADSAASGARLVLILCLALVAVILLAAAVGVGFVNKMDSIFPNVTLDGMKIGGFSLKETVELLEQEGYESPGDFTVTAELPLGVTLTLNAEEYCSQTPISEVAAQAYDACYGASAVRNALNYLRCRVSGMELQSNRAIIVDEDAVRGKVNSAAQEVQRALLSSDLQIGEDSIIVVKGASGAKVDTDALVEQITAALYSGESCTITYEAEIETDSEMDLQAVYDTIYAEKADAYFNEDCEIVPEVVGMRFDISAAQSIWDAAGYGDRVEIPLVIDAPEVTYEVLSELLFRDQLGSITSSLYGSSSNRINNVTLAAKKINEVTLMPGDEFDYNKTLGKRTAENGFLPAGAYSGGEVVQEYGGGICQVSSTLYGAALCANLKITARTCHYFPVSYLPAGLDATVSWGGPEFRFVNDREYPIKITSWVNSEDNTVTVEIWGTNLDGSYAEMEYGTWLVYDETYPDVAIGFKAQTYRCVYAADGTRISRKAEALSFYNYHDEDIKWPQEVLDERARKEAEERGEVWPSPTPTPENSPEPSPDPTESPNPEETTPPEETPIPEETPPAESEPTEPVEETI